MKIHGMCVVKDEADVVITTLIRASKWCDYIYVLDNGSSDGSWELINKLAQDNPQVHVLDQHLEPFRDSLRRDIYMEFRDRSQPGDWWCRLDSDEIYIDNPHKFLQHIPAGYQMVWAAMLLYFFTDRDLALYQQDPSHYADEVPIEQRYRYYLNQWSEPRFFREEKNLYWRKDADWPVIGANFPHRIKLKHYQFRSPEQIQKRITNRRRTQQQGGTVFYHEVIKDWQSIIRNPVKALTPALLKQLQRDAGNSKKNIEGTEWLERIMPADGLEFDDGSGEYIIREDLMPQVLNTNILAASLKKFLKRQLYRP